MTSDQSSSRSFGELANHLRVHSIDEFFAALAGNDDITILLPERTASDAVVQRLSNYRIQNCGVHWPHPGVFRLQDYAQSILKQFERETQTPTELSLKLPSKLEALVCWQNILHRHKLFMSPLDAQTELTKANHFFGLGLSFSQWKEILAESEKNASADLKQSTLRILAFLEYSAALQSRGYITSSWSFLEHASSALQRLHKQISPIPARFFSMASQRPPVNKDVFKHPIWILVVSELFPLERLFLQELAKSPNLELHFVYSNPLAQNTWQSNSYSEAPQKLKSEKFHIEPLSWIDSIPEAAVPQNHEKPKAPTLLSTLCIASCFADHQPTSGEATALLEGDFLLDLPDPRLAKGQPLLRSLKLWADFLLKKCPPGHIYLRDAAIIHELFSQFSFRHGTDVSAPTLLSAEQIWNCIFSFICEHNPLSLSELKPIEKLQAPESLLSWIEILANLGFLDFSQNPEHNSFQGRLSANGAFVGTLSEALLVAPSNIYLWGRRENLKALLNPLHPDILKDSIIDTAIDPLIEGLGVAIPNASREIRHLCHLLESHSSKLRFIPPHKEAAPHLATPMAPHHVGIRSLSPSGVEELLKCPYRFYTSRILKLNRPIEWDPESPNPADRGAWIHRVLEVYYKTGLHKGIQDSQRTHQALLDLFKTHLNEIFKDHCSPSYKKLLEAQIDAIVERCLYFILKHETALAQSFPQRQILCEQKVDTDISGQSWLGIIDRIDIVSDTELLLWDYKSGRTPSAKSETQIKNNELQWFLYCLFIEHLSTEQKAAMGIPPRAQVVGGGYLSPLKPDNSCLFSRIDAAIPLGASLSRMSKQLSCKLHSFDFCSVSESATANTKSLLIQKLSIAHELLANGTFAPTPHNNSLCSSCHVASVCGRPYLLFEEAITPLEPTR